MELAKRACLVEKAVETLIRVGQLYDRTMGFRDSANMLEAKRRPWKR